jgi:hypothetical protein
MKTGCVSFDCSFPFPLFTFFVKSKTIFGGAVAASAASAASVVVAAVDDTRQLEGECGGRSRGYVQAGNCGGLDILWVSTWRSWRSFNEVLPFIVFACLLVCLCVFVCFGSKCSPVVLEYLVSPFLFFSLNVC